MQHTCTYHKKTPGRFWWNQCTFFLKHPFKIKLDYVWDLFCFKLQPHFFHIPKHVFALSLKCSCFVIDFHKWFLQQFSAKRQSITAFYANDSNLFLLPFICFWCLITCLTFNWKKSEKHFIFSRYKLSVALGCVVLCSCGLFHPSKELPPSVTLSQQSPPTVDLGE